MALFCADPPRALALSDSLPTASLLRVLVAYPSLLQVHACPHLYPLTGSKTFPAARSPHPSWCSMAPATMWQTHWVLSVSLTDAYTRGRGYAFVVSVSHTGTVAGTKSEVQNTSGHYLHLCVLQAGDKGVICLMCTEAERKVLAGTDRSLTTYLPNYLNRR